MKSAAPHRWRFYRAGGVDQVRLDTGADILHLEHLDLKLWVALSCPVKGLEFDERTLALLDSDNDAHVRPPEILAAIRWLARVLANGDELTKGKDGLVLASIRKDTPEGKTVLAAAQHMLTGLGKAGADAITVADTMKTAEVFAQAKRNGDGVVPPATVEDAEAKKVAEEIIACIGGVADRSGAQGFDRAGLDRFFGECADYAGWQQKCDADAKAILPLREGTAAAYAALAAVRAKVADFFGRCRLAAFDPRAQQALNREETAYLEIAAKDFSITAAEVAHFPLARVEPAKPLPLGVGVNPAWSEAIASLRKLAVAPLLGDKEQLSEADWLALSAKLAAYEAWLSAKSGAAVEKLGKERVRAILAGKSKDALLASIADDLAVAPAVDAMREVEKAARLVRDLRTILQNYVSFTDFYSRRGAIFQAGTLYLDGRALDLCFGVNDPAKHMTLAAMARIYLAYVDCTRPGSEKMTVACAFTAGDSDNLIVGRNGIFFDRRGRDWNATITRIVDHPISIGQAFWAPYKKVVRWIEEQIAKRAAVANEESAARLQKVALEAHTPPKPGEPPKDAPKGKMDIGVLAAIGVAVSAVTAIVGTVLDKFFGLGYLMPLGLVGLVVLISGPAMLIAYLKLRQRNLGPILDANGWAVNTLTRVNIPLGRSLTALPVLPPGSERSLTDPYAEKKRAWPKVLLVLLLLGGIGYGLWRFEYLHKWWPGCPLPKHETKAETEKDKPATEKK